MDFYPINLIFSVTVIFYWIKQLRQVDSRNLAILSQEMTRILAMTISHDQRLRAVERLQTDLHGEAVNIHLFIDFQLGVEHADAERSSRQLRIKLEQLPFVHHAYVDVVQLEKAAYA